MTSEQYDATVAMLAAIADPPTATLQQRRESIDGLGLLLPEAPGTEIEPVDADGVEAAWVRPASCDRPTAAAMWLHGGGYNIGSVTSHKAAVSHLAASLGQPVLAVNYRLAPEHPHPAALDDALTAWDWLAGQGFDPGAVGVVGDSAGGGLAVALAVALDAAGRPGPAALALVCPWVDLTGDHPVPPERVAADVLLTPELLKQWSAAYAANVPTNDPAVSPLFADLTGLPPLLIEGGGRDLLADDAYRLAACAEAAGVDTELRIADDMIHDWILFAGLFPEAGETLDAIASWLRPRLAG